MNPMNRHERRGRAAEARAEARKGTGEPVQALTSDEVRVDDYTRSTAVLEGALSQGKVEAVVALYKFKGAPGEKLHVGMHNGGLAPQQLHHLLGVMKRAVEASHQIRDVDGVETGQGEAVDELLDAAENVVIAFGMGWEIEGAMARLMDVARRRFPQSVLNREPDQRAKTLAHPSNPLNR